jgi:hypothetical protein
MEVLEKATATESPDLKTVLFAQEGLEPFLKSMGYASLQAGAAKNALTTAVRYNGRVVMRDALIRQLIRDKRIPTMREEDRIKPLSRMAHFRANNSQQDEHQKKIKAAGKMAVYSLESDDLQLTLGAYEYAYARYLYALHQAAGN